MNHTISSMVFRVEARVKKGQPLQFGEQIFGSDWHPVTFYKAPFGVSIKEDLGDSIPNKNGYFSYRSAKALQLWFLNETGISQLETKITSHRFSMTYSITEDSYEKAIDWTCVNFKDAR